MSSRQRDRHQRGLRGPLALANPLTGGAVQPPRPPGRADFFAEAVERSITRIAARCPEAVAQIRFGVEDVPYLAGDWAEEVPLAAAVEAPGGEWSQVVVYRRPLEHRAATREGLQILCHRTIVEQLSALTGLSVEEIDPECDDD
ncbi:MAG: metallopeptidase family protein [Propionibacteriaceae bacterium]